MEYLKINQIDFSMYCNSLKVDTTFNYNAQTNAAGNTVVDWMGYKRSIEVGIIPLNDATMASLMTELNKFHVALSFRNPQTNELNTIYCIVPTSNIEYYTIQANNVLYKAMTITFMEL